VGRSDPEQRQRFSVTDFWKRRFVRLFPPYWIAALLATVPVILRLGGHSLSLSFHRTIAGWHPSPAVLALNQAVVVLTNVIPTPLLAVTWTLALEEQIYALYSLFMAKARGIRPHVPLVGSLVASVAWNLACSLSTDSFPSERAFPGVARTATNHVLYQQVPSRLFEWILGFVLAEVYAGRIRLPRWLSSLPLGIVLLIVAALLSHSPHGAVSPTGHPFYITDIVDDQLFGLAYFALLAWALRAERTTSRPLGRVVHALARIGVASYSLYLIHGIILDLGKHWMAPSGPARVADFALLWGAIAVATYGFYRLVERPFVLRSKAVGAASQGASIERPSVRV
jgi:peptidoglycan/LPS O-acetylase OafA/YrhL